MIDKVTKISDSVLSDQNDFNEFLSMESGSAGVSAEIQFRLENDNKLKTIIRKDLVRSPKQLATVYLLFSSIGYFVSLFICAQNSIGLSALSHSVAMQIHGMPDPWCSIFCGSLFTGIPFAISALFLSRFQHRYLIFKMWWFFIAVPIAATLFMLVLPNNSHHNATWLLYWALSAIFMPYILEFFVYLAVKPKQIKLN